MNEIDKLLVAGHQQQRREVGMEITVQQPIVEHPKMSDDPRIEHHMLMDSSDGSTVGAGIHKNGQVHVIRRFHLPEGTKAYTVVMFEDGKIKQRICYKDDGTSVASDTTYNYNRTTDRVGLRENHGTETAFEETEDGDITLGKLDGDRSLANIAARAVVRTASQEVKNKLFTSVKAKQIGDRNFDVAIAKDGSGIVTEIGEDGGLAETHFESGKVVGRIETNRQGQEVKELHYRYDGNGQVSEYDYKTKGTETAMDQRPIRNIESQYRQEIQAHKTVLSVQPDVSTTAVKSY